MPAMSKPTVRVGSVYEWHRGRVDPDAALAYALATNDPNERHLTGGVVPPVFTVSLIQPAMHDAQRRCADPGAIVGARGGVHAKHDIHFWKPVLPGSAVSWQVSTHSARQTAAGVVVTLRIAVHDAHDALLVEHFWSSIHLGGTIDADTGPEPADHTFPEAARARPLARTTIDVAPDQTFRYAGASGDHVPHSMDDEAAKLEGHPGKILQGLCTFAMCSGAVVQMAADGDSTRLRRFAGRFSAPMFPRRQLVVTLSDAGRADDGGQVLAFEAVCDGVTVVKHGRAELHPS
jgi:acyl dehydratase